jgi:hypothetical protein
MDIDPSKPVYMDIKYFDKLQDLARSKLIEMGFDKNQLVFAPDAAKYGEASHYIARIWKSKKGTTLTVSQMENAEDVVPGNPTETLGGESSPSFGHMVRGKMICEVNLDISQE